MKTPVWYCLDCLINRDLDTHGRCSVCQSNAVIDLSLSDANPETEATNLFFEEEFVR